MKKSFQSLVKPDLFIGYNSETSEMVYTNIYILIIDNYR